MAKYTIELRTIVESGRNIFPFEYEFYDETKRAEFERDFIRHFYFHEIGVETVDRFILNLEDKMQVVFPAYNEALKALSIEYNVLDNYFLSETTNRTVKTDGKISGVSSTRGQVFDEQQTETNENRTADTTTNENGTTTTENNGTTSANGTNKTASNTSETANGTSSKTGTGNTTVDEKNVKKYLDTPQGAVNLDGIDYLTNLTEDKRNGTTDTENSESVTDERTTTGTGTTNTETESETTSSDTGETTSERESTNKETATGKTDTSFTGQQKTTADNNTRTNRNDTTTETTEVIHKGNVGVDSDAVMIQKHLKLQQLIANTKKLFFAECEDLFMLVY